MEKRICSRSRCVAFLALVLGMQLHAATFTVTSVDDSGPGTLRQAVLDAGLPANPDADTIVFAVTGTITLSSEIVLDSSVSINADGPARGLVVDGGPGTNRIFSVGTGHTVSLAGLTLESGNGDGAASSGDGAAILNLGTLSLTDCNIFGNSVENPGPAICSGTGLTMTRCTLAHNVCGDGWGGAVHCSGAMVLNQCNLYDNATTDGYGGAIVLWSGTAKLINCTLYGNYADSDGGAIVVGGLTGGAPAVMELIHCTLSGNSSESGSTLIAVPGGNGGTIILENTIVDGSVSSFPSAVVVKGANLVRDALFPVPTGPGTVSSADPLLAVAGNYGGPTKTIPPQLGSPALDAAVIVTALATDQRGAPRPATARDIGAVELGQTTVTTAADDDNGPGTNGVSLREALTDTVPFASEWIRFAPALNGQSIFLNGQIVVSKPFTIVDATNLPGGLTVRDHEAFPSRILNIVDGSHVSLNGLTLSGRNSQGGGGAVYTWGTTLTLSRCTLSGCQSGNLGDGGAITNNGSIVTLTDCALSGNRSTGFIGGGAIYSYIGSVTLIRCTLTGNTSSPGHGGAIYSEPGNALTLTDCTLSGNNGHNGGALHSQGPLVLMRCTFAGNTAASSGGAIYSLGSAATASTCTFTNNHSMSGRGGAWASYFSGSREATLTHLTVAGNSAWFYGGGLYFYSTSATLTNCLVAGNTAGMGPDMARAGGGALNPAGTNLIGNNDAVSDAFPAGPLAGTSASPLDPLLAPLGQYGGLTQTMALLPGSPARDKAPSVYPFSDQRGFLPVNSPDIGAYEAGNFADFNAWIYESLPAATPLAQRAAAFDYDGDGRTNHSEWLALTDPASAARFFSTTIVHNATSLTFTFPTAAGRTYRLRQSDDLNAWTDTPGVTPLAGHGYTQVFTIPRPAVPRRYYQILLSRP